MSMKSIRSHDTPAWYFYAWTAFALATSITFTGIYYLDVNLWIKGFLTMGTFFIMGSTFTLSKTIRDRHEFQRDQELVTLYDRNAG
jgi:hypothetical protein